MPSQIYALALIVLAALPSFGYKTDLENRVTTELIGKPKTISQVATKSTNPVIPIKSDSLAERTSYSKAAYFIDLSSGEVLFAKNENEKLPMASTTKLMTALIALEKLKSDQIITVPTLHTLPLDSVMGLTAGDKVSVSELMHGLLIESGADAAETLAIATSGSENQFVALMNEKASMFNLTNTQFTNVVGHDATGHYSTAKDLSKLARIAMSNKQIAEIVGERSYVASSEAGKKYYLTNTNLLIGTPGYIGVKTGTTYQAGECLISLYDDGERKILGVVITSPDRFGETQDIIEWTKRVFSW